MSLRYFYLFSSSLALLAANGPGFAGPTTELVLPSNEPTLSHLTRQRPPGPMGRTLPTKKVVTQPITSRENAVTQTLPHRPPAPIPSVPAGAQILVFRDNNHYDRQLRYLFNQATPTKVHHDGTKDTLDTFIYYNNVKYLKRTTPDGISTFYNFPPPVPQRFSDILPPPVPLRPSEKAAMDFFDQTINEAEQEHILSP